MVVLTTCLLCKRFQRAAWASRNIHKDRKQHRETARKRRAADPSISKRNAQRQKEKRQKARAERDQEFTKRGLYPASVLLRVKKYPIGKPRLMKCAKFGLIYSERIGFRVYISEQELKRYLYGK